MSEVQDVFNSRKKEAHVQREEMNEFYQLCKEGKAVSGMEMEELKLLLEDLDNDSVKFSNDMVIDKIITDVLKLTKDEKLINVLENVRVTNLPDDTILGRAYPRYDDGTYYVEIGRNIDRKIRRLSDLFGVFFMFNEKLEMIECLVLYELLNANIQRFKYDEEFNEEFNEVQIKMAFCDKMIKNQLTDKYVAYAREIYEVAMAFMVGHEIGHHYYGHTDRNNMVYEDEKIKELKADSYAIGFAFEYLESAYGKGDSRYGIHQFAGIYMPLITSAYLCDNILKDEEHHPSIIKRLLGIQRRLEKLLDEEGHREVQYYINSLYDAIQFQKKLYITD